MVHGGRFVYHGEHKPADKDLVDSKEHAAMEKAFRQSEEDYHQKRLMKPRFEDF